MAIVFPTDLDVLTNPVSTTLLDDGTIPHHSQHADANDAIEALETKVGIDSSADTASIDYRLNAIEARMLFDHYADVGNVGTGEDDLYSDTIAAGQLAANGDKIVAQYALAFVSSATATRRVRAYFGGTSVFDSGALTFGSTGASDVWLTIIRESASVVRCIAEFVATGLTLQPIAIYTRVTGLTLANTQVLKVTGEAAGVGAATDDVLCKLGYVEYKPAA